ncbi:hypothetical protein [Nocardioides sp. S5]|uniref:hypothetical protein n=1 Tax=Nocardioides sp. S5 TaxID=2017486 RepID=UPI001A8EB4EF|nr:hypothetical protein [Nocardioides sp. S5]
MSATEIVRFYWELDPADKEAARDATTEEEGYLANDINWGRALVAFAQEYESVPDLTVPAPDPDLDSIDYGDDGSLAYSDPISAILQAAAYVGLDPREVCDEALSHREAIYRDSADVARRRRGSAVTLAGR